MIKFTKLTVTLCVFLFSFVATQMINSHTELVAAEVYTWVDSKGTKHYSDKPFKASKKISFSVATPKAEVEPTKLEEPELFDLSDDARLEAECATAKTNVANLLKGGKLMQKNSQGEDVELSTEEMNAKLSESQNYIKRYCTKAVPQSEGA